jgi:two-component system, LytTR family, sensor kinase
MHPVVFIGAFVLVGMLFGAQEWLNLHSWGYPVRSLILFESWGAWFFIWGVLCWLLGHFLQPLIIRARPVQLLVQVLPLSIAASILAEMIFVALFPHLPLNHAPMPYWQRFRFQMDADLADNMAIFWCAFIFFRGAAYYQQYREKETKAARLEVQLADARLAALRMQLNPHFLFNAMNSISSLMRTDIEAADSMLEQLSSLLRMTLERGDAQLIPLRHEIEFIETYLAMQEKRYEGRLRQSLSVGYDLHDALVPALILQPLVENAFVHGISRCEGPAELLIEIQREGQRLRLRVVNSGRGLNAQNTHATRPAIGLANVRDRLRLHYGDHGSLSVKGLRDGRVAATIVVPLQFAVDTGSESPRFGI